MQTENKERIKAQRQERRMVRNVVNHLERHKKTGLLQAGGQAALKDSQTSGGGERRSSAGAGGGGDPTASGQFLKPTIAQSQLLLKRGSSDSSKEKLQLQDTSSAPPGAASPPGVTDSGDDAHVGGMTPAETAGASDSAGGGGLSLSKERHSRWRGPSQSEQQEQPPQEQQRQGSKMSAEVRSTPSSMESPQGEGIMTPEKEEEEGEAEEDDDEDTDVTSSDTRSTRLLQLRKAFREGIQQAESRSQGRLEEDRRLKEELRAELSQILATGSRLESNGHELSWTIDRLSENFTTELRSMRPLFGAAANLAIVDLSTTTTQAAAELGGHAGEDIIIPLDGNYVETPRMDHDDRANVEHDRGASPGRPEGGRRDDRSDHLVVAAAQDALPQPPQAPVQPPPAARWIVEELSKDVRKVEDRHRSLEKDTRRLMAAFRELARPPVGSPAVWRGP